MAWGRVVTVLIEHWKLEMSLTRGPSSRLSKRQGHYGFVFNVLVMGLEMNTGLLFIFLFGFRAPSVVPAARDRGQGSRDRCA